MSLMLSKCMVVGSLLVMAAQTVTAADCSVTDGSKATPWTGGTAYAEPSSWKGAWVGGTTEPCTCTGASICTTLNVCDVAKKTCVCTPGKDHWCYEDAKVGQEASYAMKFGCFKYSEKRDDGSDQFQLYKCDGDNVISKLYSDAACTTYITPANGGQDQTGSATAVTKTEISGGSGTFPDPNGVKTRECSNTDDLCKKSGISTCKGGVAGASAGAAAPGPAPGPAAGAAAPSPASDLDNGAGSVAQCSTLAMLMVVAAMWGGRN